MTAETGGWEKGQEGEEGITVKYANSINVICRGHCMCWADQYHWGGHFTGTKKSNNCGESLKNMCKSHLLPSSTAFSMWTPVQTLNRFVFFLFLKERRGAVTWRYPDIRKGMKMGCSFSEKNFSISRLQNDGHPCVDASRQCGFRQLCSLRALKTLHWAKWWMLWKQRKHCNLYPPLLPSCLPHHHPPPPRPHTHSKNP